MGAGSENRYRRMVIEEGQRATDLQRLQEAFRMERKPRKKAIPPPPSARRAVVRRWLRRNANAYENSTLLAEAANAEFLLPGGGLDDETHWIWDDAADAMSEEQALYEQG